VARGRRTVPVGGEGVGHYDRPTAPAHERQVTTHGHGPREIEEGA